MTRLGLILILTCAIVGGMFQIWSPREQSQPKVPVCTLPPPLPVEEIEPAAQREVEFGPYMADLQRRIKRQWFPPKGQGSDKIEIVFKIHSNGVMSNLRILKASPNSTALACQAALKAVQNAGPFRPLPDGAPRDVDIKFTFDYNVHQSGGHTKIEPR